MNKTMASRRIHAVMRTAGYKRQTRKIFQGGDIYQSRMGWSGAESEYMIISIPGNWSLRLRDSLIEKLLQALKEFQPEVASGYTGVKVRLSNVKPVEVL